jgi:hypothetical protein
VAKLEPITDKQFVTFLSRLVEAEEWPHVQRWLAERGALAMLAAKNADERESIALEYQAGVRMVRAIEAHVTVNRSQIDGRTARWKQKSSAAGAESSAGGTRRA